MLRGLTISMSYLALMGCLGMGTDRDDSFHGWIFSVSGSVAVFCSSLVASILNIHTSQQVRVSLVLIRVSCKLFAFLASLLFYKDFALLPNPDPMSRRPRRVHHYVQTRLSGERPSNAVCTMGLGPCPWSRHVRPHSRYVRNPCHICWQRIARPAR